MNAGESVSAPPGSAPGGSRYLEDFAVGMTFAGPTYAVTADEVIAFARQYDPQPFHTDPAAAGDTVFGRHVASGWHTAAMTMRMIIDSEVRPAGGSVGAGVESLQWPRPVAPGDVLHLAIEVLDVRVSRSKPDRGIVKMRVRTLNAADDIVQEMIVSTIVPCKPAAAP